MKILFLDILTDNEKLRTELNHEIYQDASYGERIRQWLNLEKKELDVMYAHQDTMPFPKQYDGIIIGGSVKDPLKRLHTPWMRRTYRFIRRAHKAHTPLLGICGGLQFVVHALGGEVIRNPLGRNLGNYTAQLTNEGKSDPLFYGLPSSFEVILSHKCIAKRLERGWKLLSFSKRSPYNAIAIGNTVRLVQFHPEKTARMVRNLARYRKQMLIDENFATEKTFPRLIASIHGTNRVSKKIGKNFLKYFVLH